MDKIYHELTPLRGVVKKLLKVINSNAIVSKFQIIVLTIFIIYLFIIILVILK